MSLRSTDVGSAVAVLAGPLPDVTVGTCPSWRLEREVAPAPALVASVVIFRKY
jgi:hypothetical protein